MNYSSIDIPFYETDQQNTDGSQNLYAYDPNYSNSCAISMLYGNGLSLDSNNVLQESPTNQPQWNPLWWSPYPMYMNYSFDDMPATEKNRRNTVCLPCTSDNKKMKRRSMNDITFKKVTEKLPHLSKQQLIQRVVQLEKQLSIENTNPSDEDDAYTCRWAGCHIVCDSLDQLTLHIRDTHVGSGKAAYYCEWAFCPRENKPFLKRHKMQNHMRTHTGERPFECTVEGCDKRFSRPDSLNTHIKTHSNIRPFTCPIENCNKAYFHSRSLRKHVKSHQTPTQLSTPIMTSYFLDQQQIYAAGTALP